MIVEEIKIDGSSSVQTIKELRKELRQLKDNLLNVEEGTEEYTRTVQKAANIQHILREQMVEVNATAQDFGQRLGNVTDSLSGLMGGVTAITGALSLMGIEDDEVNEKLTSTMTCLIGVTEGLAKMDDGVKAFHRLSAALKVSTAGMSKFRLALISTGIGAIVVLIGTLIANWDKLTEAVGMSEGTFKKIGDVFKGVGNVIKNMLMKPIEATMKVLKGDFQGAWESIKDSFSVVENFKEGVAEAEEERLKEEEEARRKALEEQAKADEKAYKERIKLIEEEARYKRDMSKAQLTGSDAEQYSKKNHQIQMSYFKELESVYKKDSKEYRSLMLEKAQYLQGYTKHVQDEQGKVTESEMKEQEDRLALIREMDEEIRRSKMTDMERELEDLDAKRREVLAVYEKEGKDTVDILEYYRRQEQEIRDKYSPEGETRDMSGYNKTIDEFYDMLDERSMTERENELQKVTDQENAVMEALKAQLENRLITEEEYQNALTRLTEYGASERAEIEEKYNEESVNLQISRYVTMGNAVGGLLQSMSDMFEEGSEQQKGLAIASSTIQMLTGVTTALSGAFTTKSGPWDLALAAVQAASIVASGITNIKKIKQTKADKSGGGTASVPNVNMSAVTQASRDYSQTVDGAMTRQTITDQKVYVLEHDITTTQKKVEVTENNARY